MFFSCTPEEEDDPNEVVTPEDPDDDEDDEEEVTTEDTENTEDTEDTESTEDDGTTNEDSEDDGTTDEDSEDDGTTDEEEDEDTEGEEEEDDDTEGEEEEDDDDLQGSTGEYALYSNPSQQYYSSYSSSSFATCASYSDDAIQANSVLLNGTGMAHPTQSGWNLYTALEFHPIDGVCRSAEANGVCALATAYGWGDGASTFSTLTDVTDGGYVKLWSKSNNSAFSAYANRVNSTAATNHNNAGQGIWKNNWAAAVVGTRFEFRVRLTGDRTGCNYSIKLTGNANYDGTGLSIPNCGWINVMSNPAGDNGIQQWVRYMGEEGSVVSVSQDTAMPDISEWNIYWVEIVDENTIKLGVNGTTTVVATNESNDSGWPLNSSINQHGFELSLIPNTSSDMVSSNLSEENYPTMEVDWIRVWTSSAFDLGDNSWMIQATYSGGTCALY